MLRRPPSLNRTDTLFPHPTPFRSILESGCSHVGLLDESSEAAAIALFGAAIAGVPYVPLNYRLADADLGALLKRIAPAYLIGDVERVQRLDAEGGHQTRARADFVRAAAERGETASSDEHDGAGIAEIGRAHVCTPVTNAHLVYTLLRS